MLNRLRPHVLALLWAFFILVLCGIPGNRLPRLAFIDWLRPDKIVHLFLFGVLSFLLIRTFQILPAKYEFNKDTKGRTEGASLAASVRRALYRHPKIYSFVLASVYGIVIELLQEYIFINRSGEVFDAVADAVGALFGIWIYNLWMKKYAARKSI